MDSDLTDWPEDRVARAAAGVRRFERIKAAVSIVVMSAWLAVCIYRLTQGHSFFITVIIFLVGETVLAFLGPLITLPLGYLLCGKDAMTAIRVAAQAKRGY